MKRQIRLGVYETNSSMCHALSICTEEEFEKWKKGEVWWNRWDIGSLVGANVKTFIPMDKDMDDEERQDEGYTTYDEFQELEYEEVLEKEFTTPDGETVVAFGYAGHD